MPFIRLLSSFKLHLRVVQVGAMLHQDADSAKEHQGDFKMGFVLALCYHTRALGKRGLLPRLYLN